MALINDKSRKWIIAGVSVVLMLAFIPNYVGQKERRTTDITCGTIYSGQAVTLAEVQSASKELTALSMPVREGSPVTYAIAILGGMSQATSTQDAQQRYVLGASSIQALTREPELFAVLQKEAARNGIYADRDEVESIVRNQLNLSDSTDPGQLATYRQAVAALLAVKQSAEVAAAALKVTRPDVKSMVAREYQSLDLRVATFDAADFPPTSAAAAAHAPTTQGGGSVLYDQFKSAQPGNPSPDNPFGFGYSLPDRVRMDYLTISKAELLRAAEAKSPSATPSGSAAYDWDVEAQKYYALNKDEFTTKTPTSNPFAGLGDATIMVKTVRPFADVKRSILEKLYAQKGEALLQQALRKIVGTMSADYKSHVQSPKAASSMGAPYESTEYLRKLADNVDADLGVRPTASTLGERYASQADLVKVPVLGTAMDEGGRFSLPQYVFALARPLVRKSVTTVEPLELLQPTPAFTDASGNVVIGRVLDALVERTPAESEVAGEIVRDAAASAAQDRALAAAEAYKNASGAGPLSGRPIATIRSLRTDGDLPPELGLSSYSQRRLVTEAFNLLRGDPAVSHPRAVVNLAADRKVLVIELADVTPLVPTANAAQLDTAALFNLRAEYRSDFTRWFLDPSSIVSRTQYKAAKDAGK